MPIKRRLFEAKSSSEEEDSFSGNSENSKIGRGGKSSNKEEPEEGNLDLASLNVGDWVTVEYNADHFPRQIKSINGSDLLIQCLEKRENCYK
ncbi:hypothetical protein ILUMI_27073 [Ignelater luminosus]|uniref:Uncharacterized protein n=1 Tax=Ignelater luminosus TaxID=2038154 RepID=A0A8K0C5R4_IGNLU|nr:hypothetical protein ILUMI_27073 [Ignelater luminosus]